MSGGVDSSVAALLLKKQGYNLIGAFMKNYSDTKNKITGECSWKEERRMAIKIAAKLKIPLITLDFEKEYKKYVVDKMFRLYSRGITPNPDIDCNNKIKFPLLIKEAKKLKCEYIATGHYARIKKIMTNKNVKCKTNKIIDYSSINNESRAGERFCVNLRSSDIARSRVGWGLEGGAKFNYQLLRAKDESKDQSYFLYRLTQKELSKTLFPIGNYTKKQVREIARKNHFPNYNKKSTVGICFIGKINLKNFLQKKIPAKSGRILDPNGKQIGIHDGIYYYTIGQRIGPRFGIEVSKTEKRQKKWYVARKNLKRNEIIAAPEGHELNFRKEIIIKNPHWINKIPKNNSKLKSRIRQVGELIPAKIVYSKNKIKVILNKPITGISEGQAIVLYEKQKTLGGGVISF